MTAISWFNLFIVLFVVFVSMISMFRMGEWVYHWKTVELRNENEMLNNLIKDLMETV